MGQLYSALVEKDMEMLEINPPIITDNGNLKVIDTKVGLDGNAMYRPLHRRDLGVVSWHIA